MLWHQGLLYKLRKQGITGRIYTWITEFLTDRTLQVRIGTALSDTYHTEMGTPQRSVLSLLLFIFMVADFPEKTEEGIRTSLFADDSSIWATSTNYAYIYNKLQKVSNINTWCKAWGFKLNPRKTVSITFTKKY
jgi:hypothetical protein